MLKLSQVFKPVHIIIFLRHTIKFPQTSIPTVLRVFFMFLLTGPAESSRVLNAAKIAGFRTGARNITNC